MSELDLDHDSIVSKDIVKPFLHGIDAIMKKCSVGQKNKNHLKTNTWILVQN